MFLVEKGTGVQTSLVVDAHVTKSNRPGAKDVPRKQHTVTQHGLPTPSQSPEVRMHLGSAGLVRNYLEIYDYAGGTRFRGFVAEKDNEKAMFVFFDKEAIGQDLKPGYVHQNVVSNYDTLLTGTRLTALLELASAGGFECTQLVVCVDRLADPEDAKDLTKDLGWVGFELMMLDHWSDTRDLISDRWIFLGMDV